MYLFIRYLMCPKPFIILGLKTGSITNYIMRTTNVIEPNLVTRKSIQFF
jgi:hypothetical protein